MNAWLTLALCELSNAKSVDNRPENLSNWIQVTKSGYTDTGHARLVNTYYLGIPCVVFARPPRWPILCMMIVQDLQNSQDMVQKRKTQTLCYPPFPLPWVIQSAQY